jgi:hypothetical protein
MATKTLFDPNGFLIERQGTTTKEGGLLTILSGQGAGGAGRQAGLGLSYYDPMFGNQYNMDKFMVQGNKGYYNALAIMASHPGGFGELLKNPDLVSQYAPDDKNAQIGLRKVMENLHTEVLGGPPVLNGGKAPTQYLTGNPVDPSNPMATKDIVMGTGKTANELLDAKNSITNFESAMAVAGTQKMPIFTPMEAVQSGEAANLQNVRARKQVGKPGGYGAPVFNLLSGAPPTDNLLGA